jgi:hypothetical protein
VPVDHLRRILAALNEAYVRYVVVGGVAAVLHGHLRFTADLDLVLALERENVLAALEALRGLGFRPPAPVAAERFAEAEVREQWVREEGMTVFSRWTPTLPGTDVDLFAEEPIPFPELEARAWPMAIGALIVPVASIPDLRSFRAPRCPRDPPACPPHVSGRRAILAA